MDCGCVIENRFILHATLGTMQTIEAELSGPNVLEATVIVPRVIVDPYDEYEGPYEVTPKFREQTLETVNKLMTDDVTVHTIPVNRTLNPSGGNTVSIGV